MTNRTEHVIEVEKLTKRYGDFTAVNDISFRVRKGEVFALLGPNGAGKTTPVEIINTIRTPTSGKTSRLGMDVTKKKHDIVPRIPNKPWGDAHKEARRRGVASDQKGRGTSSYFLKRMAALTPPKPAEIERAIFTFFSLDLLGT